VNAPENSPLPDLKNPVTSARAVGLRYVTDYMPGICCEHSGRGFRVRYSMGDLVRDPVMLRRITSLAIPPAWTQVWICPDPAGHLQATGRDDRGGGVSRAGVARFPLDSGQAGRDF
jgi:DNA topoisomerase-1